MAHPLLAGLGHPMKLEHIMFASLSIVSKYVGDVINEKLDTFNL